MQRFIQVYVGLFTIFFLPFLLEGQTATKVKYYKGRIDDISDVTVSLECEQKNCSGELIYIRSKDRFQLKGTRKGNLIRLQEFNQASKCTGYLNGKIEGNTIQLKWSNKSGDIGNHIKLKEVSRKPDFPTFCGDNKWINSYNGVIKGEAVDMILHRVDNHRILGTAHYKDRQKKVLINGTLAENDNLQLNFLEEHSGDALGSLRGIYKPEQNISATFYNPQNVQHFVSFNLKKSLAVSCLEYADYYTNYDFIFPKSDHAIFNEIMVILTKDWIGDCRRNSQNIRKKNADVKARASQRAYSWTDVALLTDDFISGMLTYQATWANGQATKTFNFDLNAGEAIELIDIFKKGFDYKLFIKKYAAEEIIKNPFYKNNKGFRNWIKNQEFSYFTLGQEGISFYTPFHIIYDRQRIMIPYKKLKGHIRKNSPVRKLF